MQRKTGSVFSAVLRCAGDTKTPLRLNAGANTLNIILNYFLIFPALPGGAERDVGGTGRFNPHSAAPRPYGSGWRVGGYGA